MVERLVINCDGAARGNPGPAGAGASLATPDGEVLAEIAEGLGETTNNVAEYTAAILGLERARELGAREVVLRSDSLLLINQLTGRYRVKTAHLQPLHRRSGSSRPPSSGSRTSTSRGSATSPRTRSRTSGWTPGWRANRRS